jgi:hypothetical protein
MIPRGVTILFLAFSCLLAHFELDCQSRAQSEEVNMTDNPKHILEVSQDPRELVSAAQELAKSTREDDHEALLEFLRSEEFLGRLDSEEEYRGPSGRLRLVRVLRALGRNKCEAARTKLVLLTQEKAFTKNWARADILIEAVAVIRPALPEVIEFWDLHCQPEDGFMSLTITALVENGSRPALALLEKKMANDGFEEDERIGWMHNNIMPHRNDVPLLESCERMLSGGLSPDLRPALVEALFDYRPNEWFGADPFLEPPPLKAASSEALTLLNRIGRSALKNISLTTRQRQAVNKTLEEIEEKLQ